MLRWRQFLQCLKYKSVAWGKELIEVSRWFPSTTECYRCGRKHKMQLSDRLMICECGLKMNRDKHAAIRVKGETLKQLLAAGTTVLKLVELPGYRS